MKMIEFYCDLVGNNLEWDHGLLILDMMPFKKHWILID